MRVAMPIWGDRISPVMDAATRLLIVEYDGDGEVLRTEEPIASHDGLQVAHKLTALGIGLLICGGISQELFSLIESQRISVIPWVTGPVDEILRAYNSGGLESPRFLMPGCRGRGRGRRHRRGGGGGRGQFRSSTTQPGNFGRRKGMQE